MFLIIKTDIFHILVKEVGSWGYVGAFIAGALFVSTFTVATGALLLFVLAETLHPLEVGLIAGLGAVVSDLCIFRFVRDGLAAEVGSIYKRIDTKQHVRRLFRTKYFAWALPVVGALIIASPLPDELGISLLGISKLKTYQFILLSFVLNVLGITLVVASAPHVL